MDDATLLAHRELWTEEPEPTQRDWPRLTADERALYDDLRWKRLGDAEGQQVRLEQERIGFGLVVTAVHTSARVMHLGSKRPSGACAAQELR